MRWDDIYYSSAKSTNQVELEFPYAGGSNFSVSLSKNGKTKKTYVYIVILKGQIIGDSVSIKIDDGNVKSYSISDPRNYDPTLRFITYNVPLYKALKQAKSFIIEVSIYWYGRYQFKFSSSEFKNENM